MQTERHEADNHAPFAHFILTLVSGTQFVVCAFCRHWVDRRADNCKCAASCHAQAREEVFKLRFD